MKVWDYFPSVSKFFNTFLALSVFPSTLTSFLASPEGKHTTAWSCHHHVEEDERCYFLKIPYIWFYTYLRLEYLLFWMVVLLSELPKSFFKPNQHNKISRRNGFDLYSWCCLFTDVNRTAELILCNLTWILSKGVRVEGDDYKGAHYVDL